MSHLRKLPNETLLQIISEISPDDIVNFALCSKLLSTLAADRLKEHRQLQATWTKLDYSGSFMHEDKHHPVKLLRILCLDERIASYPRVFKISYYPWPANSEPRNYLVEEEILAEDLDLSLVEPFVHEILDEFGSLIDDKLCRSLCYDTEEISIWRRRLRSGSRGVILCLLLLFLPNIEAVRLKHYGCEDDIIRLMVESIIRTHEKSKHLSSVALRKLLHFSMEGSDSAGNDDFPSGSAHILAPIATLPSLRSITTKFVFDRHNCIRSVWPIEYSSNITSLSLSDSGINEQTTALLLKSTNCLKSFSYDFYTPTIREYLCDAFAISSILGMLTGHTATTLEHLSLSDDQYELIYEPEALKGLRDFVALKSIRIDVRALLIINDHKLEKSYGEVDYKRFQGGTLPLTEFLPSSLKYLELVGRFSNMNLSLILKGMLEHKAESLPNLKTIVAQGCFNVKRRGGQFWTAEWQRNLKDVGVELIL